MSAPDSELVKSFCGITGSADDDIVDMLIASAMEQAKQITGVDYATAAMPACVLHWICAHVSFWFENRSEQGRVMLWANGLLDSVRNYGATVAP